MSPGPPLSRSSGFLFLLLSAPPCKPALFSASHFSRGLPACDEAASPASSLFASSLKLGFPSICHWLSPAGRFGGGCAVVVSGPVQAQGWPPGERAGVGKAWASGFQARATETLDLLARIILGIFSPFSHCDKQTLYRLCNLVFTLEKGTLTYQRRLFC